MGQGQDAGPIAHRIAHEDWKRGKETHPHTSSLLRQWPFALTADFVLNEDPRPLYYKPPVSIYYKIALHKAILGP